MSLLRHNKCQIHHYNNIKCATCISYDNDWKSYHKPTITQNYAQNLNNEIDSLLNQLYHGIENVRKELKLKFILHDCQESISDIFSIDHVAQNSNEAAMFMELLVLRDLDSIDKGMDESRDI